jgi:hypothetical protein
MHDSTAPSFKKKIRLAVGQPLRAKPILGSNGSNRQVRTPKWESAHCNTRFVETRMQLAGVETTTSRGLAGSDGWSTLAADDRRGEV